MDDTIFDNIEKKLKFYAKAVFVCGMLPVFTLPLFGSKISDTVAIICLIFGLFCFLNYVVLSCFIYAFADLLEHIKEINRTLKIGFSTALEEVAAEQQRLKQQQDEQENARRQAEFEKAQKEQAQQQAKAAAKQARIAAYWEKRPDEFRALKEKQSDAKEKLSKLSGLAGDQKKQLQELIQAIENELTKDREE